MAEQKCGVCGKLVGKKTTTVAGGKTVHKWCERDVDNAARELKRNR